MKEDKMLTNDEFLEVLSFEVAMADAEQAGTLPETTEERLAIDHMDRRARRLIQELRRRAFEEIRQRQPEPKRRPVSARMLAMGRDVLIERLRQLQATSPVELQLACRRLAQLDDDDLRVMLTDLEDAVRDSEER
jgi:hypothetical protein